MLADRQTTTVAETLRAALADSAASTADPHFGAALGQAATVVEESTKDRRPPHPALPLVGATASESWVVSNTDTAAAMGHPDTTLAVLGSPQLSLWFEIAASILLPTPNASVSHVGVGILVHHLAPANVGERVVVHAAVDRTTGRHVTFRCAAMVGTRLVGIGTHQRVLRETP